MINIRLSSKRIKNIEYFSSMCDIMGLVKWAEKKLKGFGVWDLALLKTTVAIAGIIIGAYISTFVKTYVWYFAVAFVVLYVWLLYRVFSR